ncbi:hypothetical protein O6H91_06G118600 [Diphasiastrum complanatum]|uniref:Uncharacterized protein n=1 Tax=Diphasiastrum complanatum TaxID=34168 RepID=A0ACC2DI08_DIPCM|nr:hypothetical protein O6H91_06G118600 [Diphasiastrum complanatum]
MQQQRSRKETTNVKMVDLKEQQNCEQLKVDQEEGCAHCTSISAHNCCNNIGFKFWGVKCWRSLRSWMSFLIPACCSCGAISSSEARVQEDVDAESVLGATVTGTIFGCRKGKVTFCIQEDPKGSPLMLLELAMPTYLLVKEMSSGLVRIALECERDQEEKARSLYAEPVWSMFCNGHKVGFALKRQLSDNDKTVLKVMQSVSMGAGVIPLEERKPKPEDDEIMYMRANYERVVGCCDSESFHMINPDGSPEQELSIFLLRS